MIPKIKQMLTRLAVENTGVRGRFKLAAGIVYKSQLIATGLNSYKSHPIMCEWGTNADSIYLHAEIDAIKNALKLITQSQLTKCDIYIVRVKRPYNASGNWEEGLAKPCPGCRRAIESFGLKRVFWTEDSRLAVNYAL
jgi:tRNA(Arg) A34 adenosine deaminase TadA